MRSETSQEIVEIWKKGKSLFLSLDKFKADMHRMIKELFIEDTEVEERNPLMALIFGHRQDAKNKMAYEMEN